MSDPFEELAQRLVILSLIQKSDSARMLPLLFTGLTALTKFVSDMSFEDSKGLLAKFRNATDEEREALVSPMTRMFGCNPGEAPERRHVTAALENLASMDIVGVRSRFRDFSALLAGMLGHDLTGDYEPVVHPSISALADRLSRISLVADLLEDDLALYSFAEELIVVGAFRRLRRTSRATLRPCDPRCLRRSARSPPRPRAARKTAARC